MEIKLYNTVSENICITKTLTDEKVVTGFCRADVDIVSPTIRFSSVVNGYNYCYIEAFGRYYYIDTLTVRSGFSIAKLHCDVLMSYADEIKNLKAIIDRQQTKPTEYITEDYTVDVRPVVEMLEFPNEMTADEYILICMKGGSS